MSTDKPADYFSATGKRKPTAQAQRWWTMEGVQLASGIQQTCTLLHKNQTARLQSMLTHARLYGNLSSLGPLGINFAKFGQLRPGTNGKSSFNVCQSTVDSVAAKISKSKPEPMFLTSGGNFHQMRRAQKLNDWVNGVFYENKLHTLKVQTFRDAAIWGNGILHCFNRNRRVAFERVMPAELLVDEIEAFYGEPRQMHRVKAVDKGMLCAAYPDAKGLADQAPTSIDGQSQMGTSDLVQVIESWHLPSGPESEDGKHVITCGECVLFEEEWERDDFPFAILAYSPRQYGFWAQSLIEQLQGIQTEINQLSWVAQQSFRLAGSFKVFMKAGSKVVKEHLNNDIGAIIEYAGDTPPQYATPPIIAPEHLQRIETLKQNAYELAGISQLSAVSQKPAGLNSGKALREYNDIESDRFTTIGQAWEQLTLDCARIACRTAKQIADGDGESNLSVRIPGKKSLKKIDWSACAMDEEDFVTKCFPVSSLPNEPAGRLQTIQEMVQAGMISPERGRRLLDFPDLAAEEGLQNAQLEYLHSVFDGIVDDGEYSPPEPTDDLQSARELCLEYYAQGKSSDLEPERLEMLLQYMEQIDALQQEAMPPPMPAQGAAPQAAPMAPPQSDLIPNAPGAMPPG